MYVYIYMCVYICGGDFIDYVFVCSQQGTCFKGKNDRLSARPSDSMPNRPTVQMSTRPTELVPVRPTDRLSAPTTDSPPVRRTVHRTVQLSARGRHHPTVQPTVRPSACPPDCPPVCPSVRLSARLSICLLDHPTVWPMYIIFFFLVS